MIEASSNSNDYKPIESGTYMARCFSMIQIGTVQQEYKGEIKELNKVRITWEIPTELKIYKEGEEPKPLTVSKEFTLSLHEKANLRKFLESWRGKAFNEQEAKKFNISKLLGIPCMLSVIHKTSKSGNSYADISSVSSLPKGMQCEPQINENFEFSFTPYEQYKFDLLPDWLKDKIKTSKEYKSMIEPNNNEINVEDNQNEENDDLPF